MTRLVFFAFWFASSMDAAKLESTLGVTFANKDLLIQAFVHRSYLNENPRFYLDHNERLEFLGDAVLELIVTDYLYAHYPNPEGDLTAWRAALVNAKMLAKIAERLHMNDFLLLSKGEAKDKGKARQVILANAIEAFIGAMYLDKGYDAVTPFVHTHIIPELAHIIALQSYKDAKSTFQELAQEKKGITPRYIVLKEWGPDHAKNFSIGVYLNDEQVGVGEGVSKQEAQQSAADDALTKLGWRQ